MGFTEDRVIEVNEVLKLIAQEGIRHADKLVLLCWDKLIGIAMKELRSYEDSEDVVLDVICEIEKIAEKYNEEFCGYNYLCKVVKNRAIDYIRKTKRCVSLDDISPEPDMLIDYTHADTMVDVMVIKDAMETLTEDERKVMQLRFWNKKTVKEIGLEMGISQSTVNRIYISGKAKLKAYLENKKE